MGADRIQFLNYPDCIELSNGRTRVVLGPHVGGRVLVYEVGGKNVLYLSDEESEWEPGKDVKEPSAGRFDVGPEMMQTRGSTLWNGRWTAEITGDRSARMTSAIDQSSGFQVVRDFALSAGSSRLRVTQTVTNHGRAPARQCYWSRTFTRHGGTVIVPLTPEKSRFPNGYVMYTTGPQINVRPEDPAVRHESGYLLVTGPTEFPKLGMDSHAGWVAYQTDDDQLFVKCYNVDPTKPYGEVTGMTLSVWYPTPDVIPTCEVEPIGPMETLAPGASASFSVDWWLLDLPTERTVDPTRIAEVVGEECLREGG